MLCFCYKMIPKLIHLSIRSILKHLNFLLFIISISDYLFESYELPSDYEQTDDKLKGKKTYHCNCSRVFVSAGNLLFHQQNECGRKRLFKCNECRYASNRRTNFKRHLESSHHKRNMQRWFWNWEIVNRFHSLF